MDKKYYILGGLTIGALILVGSGCLNKNRIVPPPELTASADVQVTDQNLNQNNQLNISKIVAPEDGWINIHAVDDDGLIGGIIGTTQVNKGESKNIKVVISNKTKLTPNVAAMLHYDRGEKWVFETDKDGPALVDGVVIMRKFTVLNFADV